jgi:hypothetical protein
MLTARMPYDYAESESELVSGSSTDLASVNFSLGFLTELTEFVTLLTVLVVSTSITLLVATTLTVSAMLICYIPRILHCRTYVVDIVRQAFY